VVFYGFFAQTDKHTHTQHLNRCC